MHASAPAIAAALASPSTPDASPHRPSLAGSALLVASVTGLLMVAPHLRRGLTSPFVEAPYVGWTVVSGASTLLLLMLLRARRVLLATLTSLPFAVVTLGAILLATVAGTFVLQGAAPDEYVTRYGASGARVIRALRLDDIFHSPWFSGLLGLLALGLSILTVRQRTWQVPLWGHGLAHGGVVVVLAAGVIGQIGGARGFIDLHEGQTTDRMRRTDGAPERFLPLGFSVRLDTFDVDRYEDAWRLFLYEPDAAGQWQPRRAFSLDGPWRWMAMGRSGDSVRIVGVHPDASDPGGAEWRSPAVDLEHRIGDGVPRRLRITSEHGAAARLSDGHSVLLLDRRGDDVRAFTSRLTVLQDGEPVHEALVRVNEPLSFGGFMIYQSNHRPDDPTYSGFLVVRDPGLPVAFTGFAMMVLGVWYIAFVRPRLLARRDP